MKRAASFILACVLRPLCWLRIHPVRSSTGKSGRQRRCDVCGRYVKGAE